ncbi:MAG: hypothetical protein AAF827_04925 [Cyanobacteria bacterium P01_D01_bin.6]
MFTGLTTEDYVQITFRTANDLRDECLLLADCCTSFLTEFNLIEFHQVSVKMVEKTSDWVTLSISL